MVSTRLTAMVIMVWCCTMTASEQYWKWHKPYTWNSSPKLNFPMHSAVYGKPLPRPYSSAYEKPRDHCELRKAVFTQDAESPQVSETQTSMYSGSFRFTGRFLSLLYKLILFLCLFLVHRIQDQNSRLKRIHAVPLAQHFQLHARSTHILVLA